MLGGEDDNFLCLWCLGNSGKRNYVVYSLSEVVVFHPLHNERHQTAAHGAQTVCINVDPLTLTLNLFSPPMCGSQSLSTKTFTE